MRTCILIGLLVSVLTSCHTLRQDDHAPRTLIIFYDPAIGPAPLLYTAERCGATVVYRYDTLKGIALTIPQDKNLRRAMRRLCRTKGVLSVQPDRKMQLH